MNEPLGSPETKTGYQPSPSFVRFAPPILLVATFVAMLSISWGKWPDLIVDFGRELYVPWQLGEGKVLGRDLLLWPTGSLSPYLNALAFQLFGVGLQTLVLVNLALLAGLTWLLFCLLEELGDRFAATAACVVFLVVFAFGQYESVGNYNFVTPYSHGATHGVILALCALAFAWRHARTSATRDLALSSLLVGAVLLTKPEIAAACLASTGLAWMLRLRDAPDRPTLRRWALAMALPILVAPLISLGILSSVAGPAVAFRATFAPWLILGSGLGRTSFYVRGLGLEAPGTNALRALGWLGGYAAVFGIAAVLDLRARTARQRFAVAAGAILAITSAWLTTSLEVWVSVARPLPLLAAGGAAAAIVTAWRAPRPRPPRLLLVAGFTTFALVLLFKMALNARVRHYGFLLAMPAALLLVTWLLSSAPRLLRERGGSGTVFRSVSTVIVALVALSHLTVSKAVYETKDVAVGTGPDIFLTDRRGLFANAVMAAMEKDGRPGALAVFPEGVMLNYLMRRESPSPHLVFMPDALTLWSEQELLAPFKAAPPRYAVIATRETTEYGPRLFGLDYALETKAWLKATYEPVILAGASPFDPTDYGMVLLRLRERLARPLQEPPAAPAPAR